jgi:hypothetical protein
LVPQSRHFLTTWPNLFKLRGLTYRGFLMGIVQVFVYLDLRVSSEPPETYLNTPHSMSKVNVRLEAGSMLIGESTFACTCLCSCQRFCQSSTFQIELPSSRIGNHWSIAFRIPRKRSGVMIMDVTKMHKKTIGLWSRPVI